MGVFFFFQQMLASVALVWLEIAPLGLKDAPRTPRFEWCIALLAERCASFLSTSFVPLVSPSFFLIF